MAVNTIDSYQFGQIVINGKTYTSDVIIFPDRVKSNWWKKSGHQLSLEDIAEVITEKPEVLIVGTGAYGMMEVLAGAEQALKAQGIELIAETTDKAYHTYNELCRSQKVAAALHLTC